MRTIVQLEGMLTAGQDNALLRFALGNAYLKEGQPAQAAVHLGIAVKHDPGYSAAWKMLGRALAETGQDQEAIAAFEEGIRVADGKGDVQAAKEMQVFLKRLYKTRDTQ